MHSLVEKLNNWLKATDRVLEAKVAINRLKWEGGEPIPPKNGPTDQSVAQLQSLVA